MKIVDLTHLIEISMPVYPGTEPPQLDEANKIVTDGFAEKRISMHSHTGTHMDAPAHMLANSKTLDQYGLSEFYGNAVMVDFSVTPVERMGLERLAQYQDLLEKASFLVLRTGWAKRWGQADYFNGFPALTPQAAKWLVGLGIRGIGVDAISIDRMEDSDFPIHNILFNAGVFVIENLANLRELGQEFVLGCFPLKIKDADGAPARVAAFSAE